MKTSTLNTFSDYNQNYIDSILSYQPGPISADAPIAQAATQIFMIQLQLILTYQPIAIEGIDPEGVHKLRVGLRRLRTALKLFRPYLQPEFHELIKSESKQFASQLGSMRDLDVLKIDYFNHFQSAKLKTKSQEAWDVTFQPVYDQTREDAVTLLQSKAFYNLIVLTYRLYEEPEVCFLLQDSVTGSPKTIPGFIPPKISKSFKQVQSYHGVLTPKSDYSVFHALRLDIKKLRYMLEFFPEILNTKTALKIIHLLVKIQDHLGYLNDSVVACRLLTRQENKMEYWPESMQSYQAYREKEYKALISGFFPLWKKFNRRYNLKIIQKQLSDLES
jgi:CHAD domain-containing protein